MQSSTIIGLVSTALAIIMAVLFLVWRIPIVYMLLSFVVLIAVTYAVHWYTRRALL
jgi:hypothetical protein